MDMYLLAWSVTSGPWTCTYWHGLLLVVHGHVLTGMVCYMWSMDMYLLVWSVTSGPWTCTYWCGLLLVVHGHVLTGVVCY